MVEMNLDKSKTMLLMADFSTTGIGQNPIAQEKHTVMRPKSWLSRTLGG
jgi:hypothetical protein